MLACGPEARALHAESIGRETFFPAGSIPKTRDQIQKIKSLVEKALAPLGRKVYTFVNYDNFNILPELVDEYTDAVKDLVEKYYEGVTRFTTSTFLRMKLGESLEKRRVASHIYESREEARKALKKD
jgi:propionate CoA-transferase